MTKVRDWDRNGSGNTLVAWQRLRMHVVGFRAKRSNEVLSSLSNLYCKLNGKRFYDQMLKCSREVSMIIWVDIECIDYSWIFNFDCRYLVFWTVNRRAFESRFLWYEEAKRIRTTNAKPYLESLRLSEQISNALTGLRLKFLDWYELLYESWSAPESGRLRIFSKREISLKEF